MKASLNQRKKPIGYNLKELLRFQSFWHHSLRYQILKRTMRYESTHNDRQELRCLLPIEEVLTQAITNSMLHLGLEWRAWSNFNKTCIRQEQIIISWANSLNKQNNFLCHRNLSKVKLLARLLIARHSLRRTHILTTHPLIGKSLLKTSLMWQRRILNRIF